ncbi:hypothetical protein BHE74_00012771 [Ensete ventricosum]|nr:hypothetical protein GW17_00001910 [Ensete ventricosum]RWW78967.1 hypothetical protein BHE74_00012771 [Ensete ventricosum]RZS02169.1 hypothetical protein BHM03_00032147 [Ensete ventricosum]
MYGLTRHTARSTGCKRVGVGAGRKRGRRLRRGEEEGTLAAGEREETREDAGRGGATAKVGEEGGQTLAAGGGEERCGRIGDGEGGGRERERETLDEPAGGRRRRRSSTERKRLLLPPSRFADAEEERKSRGSPLRFPGVVSSRVRGKLVDLVRSNHIQ